MRDSVEGDLSWSAGAAGAWSAIRSWASGQITEVLVVHRGEGRFWSELAAEMQCDGTVVRLMTLRGRDQRWNPSLHTTGAAGDLLIYHDPLGDAGTPPGEPAPTTQFSDILDRFRYAVFLGYPHGLSDRRLQLTLERRYLAAMTYPVRALQRRAEAVRALVRSATRASLRQSGADDGLTLVGPFEAHHDWTLQGAPGRLLQLPLGEAWITLEASHRAASSGTTSVPSRGAGQVRLVGLGVEAGRAGTLPLCELGVGVNPAIIPLGNSVLSEKADSALHLGLGENRSIGGFTSGPPHGDLMLDDCFELSLTLPPGLHDDQSDVVLGRHAETFLAVSTMASGELIGVVPLPDSGPTFIGLPTSLGGAEAAEELTVTRFPAVSSGEHRDNMATLELLADPRCSEVVRWATGARRLGAFGVNSAGIGHEPAMQRFYEAAGEILGPLPWGTIEVVVGDNPVARGISRPGVILVDPAEVENQLQLRWLYVAHELVHQWLGGMLRLGPKHASAWEAVCELLAHAIAVAVLGRDTAHVFTSLQQRQGLLSGSWDLGWTGRSVASLRRDLRDLRSLLLRSVSSVRRMEDIDVRDAFQSMRPAVAGSRES